MNGVKLVVALTFPVHPPLGGGQVRIYNLFREIAGRFDVELVTLTAPGGNTRRIPLAPGFWETRVPKSLKHAEQEAALEQAAGNVVSDIAVYRLYQRTPEYLEALRAASDGAVAVIASHPYTLAAIREVSDAPLFYDAQDVEALLKPEVLGGRNETTRSLLRDVAECERDCCRQAQLVWACSAEDRSELIRRYGADPKKVIIVPNGAALDALAYAPPSVRRERKRLLRLETRLLAVFIASWHQPNIDGAKRLLELAAHQRAVEFLILGSVGQALGDQRVPNNVQLMGPVSAGLKDAVLGVGDLALNPITTGSGTNIKMLDYFGSGIPVVSTKFGARGLGVRPDEHYLEADPDEFAIGLERLRELDLRRLDALADAARQHVESTLSWTTIAAALRARIETLVGAVSG